MTLSQDRSLRGTGRTYRMLERAVACVKEGKEGIIIGNRHVHDMFLSQVRKAMPAAEIEKDRQGCVINGQRWRILSRADDKLRGLKCVPLFVDHYTLETADSRTHEAIKFFGLSA